MSGLIIKSFELPIAVGTLIGERPPRTDPHVPNLRHTAPTTLGV
jgi:hypothetical protein